MSTAAAHLGEVVLERRRDLDLTQLDVWQAGGPSNTTLTKIENGLLPSLTRKTARALDVGLQWEPGSARRAWDGGTPTPLLPGVQPKHSARLRRIIEEADEIDDEKRAEILRIIDTA